MLEDWIERVLTEHITDGFKEHAALARVLAAEIVPPGWHVVPYEPDEKMLAAAEPSTDRSLRAWVDSVNRTTWKAMVRVGAKPR